MAVNISASEWASVLASVASLTNNISTLKEEVRDQEIELQSSEEARLNFWLLVAAFNILLMQAGFALLEVGTVQAKNAKSILFKNMVDMCTGVILWWIMGYEFFRHGLWEFRFSGMGQIDSADAVFFFHSFTYSTTCATIISGGVAERISFSSYMALAAVMIGFIYPVFAHWTWGQNGWLADLGFLDFAGSGVIHALGGTATFVTASMLGPRIGRFLKDSESGQIEVHPIKGHSPVLASLGTFILIFGWFSFNASSALGADTEHFRLSARAAVNTVLAAASASVFAIAWRQKESGVHDLEAVHNTMLCGAVTITGCCAYVDFWVAPLVGIASTIGYYIGSRITMNFYVDDPLDAFSVHGGGGIMGVLVTGIFANPAYLDEGQPGGIIYTGSFDLLGAQLLGLLMVLAWGGLVFGLFVYLIGKAPGFSLRVDKDAELLGLDFAYHDGFAYPDFNKHNVITFNEMKAAERRVEARNRGKKAEVKKVSDLGAALKRQRKHKRRVDENGVSYTGSSYSASASRTNETTTFQASMGSSLNTINEGCSASTRANCSPFPVPGGNKPWSGSNSVAPGSPATTPGTPAMQTWKKETELRGATDITPRASSSSSNHGGNPPLPTVNNTPPKREEDTQTLPVHTHPRTQEGLSTTTEISQKKGNKEQDCSDASLPVAGSSNAPFLECMSDCQETKEGSVGKKNIHNSGTAAAEEVPAPTLHPALHDSLPGDGSTTLPGGVLGQVGGCVPGERGCLTTVPPRNRALPPVRRRSSGGLLPVRRPSAG